jgi:hypothetical protein
VFVQNSANSADFCTNRFAGRSVEDDADTQHEQDVTDAEDIREWEALRYGEDVAEEGEARVRNRVRVAEADGDDLAAGTP